MANPGSPIVTDDSIPMPYVTCGDLQLPESGGCPTVPTLVSEACPTGQMIWVDPDALVILQNGTGARPFVNVDSALASAPAGSVLYLQPGNQSFVGAGALVIDQAVVLAGPGGAVLDP